ncbi:MAG: transcriptional repressor [Chloroflexi bacterium]|nr:transcriptional repressor [Chloroflexota bacterium]
MTNLTPRLQRLRDAGYRITNARAAVLKALEQSGGHLTSAQIVDIVASIDPAVGRASVFRTLDLLSRLSLIRPTYTEGSSAPVFVLLPGGHHHHVICTHCGRVFEFENCGLEGLSARLEVNTGVHIAGHLLEFYGICADCAASEAVSSASSREAPA